MARYEVLISDQGFAAIDGESLVPETGQSVHEAVLDRLQRYAVERDAAVEATVNDGPDHGHFVLEVSPDGSSRLLTSTTKAQPDQPDQPDQPEEFEGRDRLDEPDQSKRSDPVSVPQEPSSPEPGPVHDRTGGDSAGGDNVGGGTAVATAVARATAAARAAAPAPVPVPAVVLPSALAGPIGRINELAAAGLLDEAYALATELRENLTDEAGADDPHAVEARAVEAYIAHLRGDHRQAVVLALAVARIRCRTGDRRAPEEVVRAAAAWQWLDDDRAAAAHGRELLHMWDHLDRHGALPSVHGELAGRVRRRVDALEDACL
ncbi:hypothetical protein [Streptomyces adustus]|uniref:hypothetical protein n=1 Tax=Streptomyces adustus TaxID=1609272 RepID=UPI0012DFF432|nr:hypothetical protein [Streptomyces adustus]